MMKIFMSLLLLSGMALCQPQQQQQQQQPQNAAVNTEQNGTFATRNTPMTASESRISREVRHELLMDPYYSIFDNLAYKVEGSTVTLYGNVVNPVVKSDAESAVKHIEGVDKVVNKINVLPPSPMDDQIRREEYRHIFSTGGLYKYAMGAVPPLHIIVDNGHVTLVGVVDSQADKNLAGIAANQVPNVFSVKNDLQVESSGNNNKK